MLKNNNMYDKSILAAVLLLGLLITGSTALATSINRMSIVNLAGYQGKSVKTEVILEGTDIGGREGFWYTHYKEVEGDDERMDITSWITVTPEKFIIQQGEKIAFTVKVKIPRDAQPGLWGATSEEAGQEGHSSERRTYIVFKDAPAGGNVYSGLLIPVSVQVLQSQSFFEPIVNFVLENIITIMLLVVVLVMAVLLFRRKKH